MRDYAAEGSPGSPKVRGSLAGTRFLAAFENADERLALQAVTQRARAYQADVDLAREGEVGARLLVVTEGWAFRYRTTREGCRQIVTLTVPGEVANLDALMFERPDFGVRSLTPVTVVAISCEDARALAAHHAGIGGRLMRMALTENAILGQRTLCLGRQSAQQRLAHFLCENRRAA